MSVARASPAPSAAAVRRSRMPKAQPRQRLYSTNSPSLVRPRLETSSTPAPSVQPRRSKQYTCPNPDCGSSNVIEDNGAMICATCATEASEQSHIVSEIQFGETSAGAPTVQGQYVSQDQTHARSSTRGQKGPGYGAGGGDGPSSRAMTELQARKIMKELQQKLVSNNITVPENLVEPGVAIFKLSLAHNFVQGRSISTVAAVAFYLQCRREQGRNEVMLIDIAECMGVNVFHLGKMYTSMIEKIYGTHDHTPGKEKLKIDTINPENLIRRFAKHLEFPTGPISTKVVNDAIKLVQRMDRDWMVTGRRPAGICGAALVLAARMNNFRRTVREVVLVVKVTEITINKRLEEFGYTESSKLTVDQFRNITLDRDCDPPAFYQARLEKKPKKKKKGKIAAETAAEIEDEGNEDEEDTRAENEAPARKRPRLDADGFAIPDIPIDPALRRSAPAISNATNTPSAELPEISALLESSSKDPPVVGTPEPTATSTVSENENQMMSARSTTQSTTPEPGASSAAQSRSSSVGPGEDAQPRRRSGRPKGAKNWEPPPATAAELALEAEIETEMRQVLDSNMLQPPDPALAASRIRTSATPDFVSHTASTSAEPPDASVQTTGEKTPNKAAASTGQIPNSTPAESIIPSPGPASASPPIDSPPTPTNEPPNPVFTPDDLSLLELDDDPEVSACILTETEKEIKERIWVSENADWLRKDHAKKIKAELQAAADREAGIDPDEAGQGGGGQGGRGKKRKRGRLGDTSYLKDGKPGSQGTVAESAGIAIKGMLQHRGYSRRVNLIAWKTMFGADDEESDRRSRSSSTTATGKAVEDAAAASPTTPAAGSETSAESTASKPKRKPRPKPVPRKAIDAVPVPVSEPGVPADTPKVPRTLPPSYVSTATSRGSGHGRAPGGQAGFEDRERKRQERASQKAHLSKEWDDGEEEEGEEEQEGEPTEAEKEERSWNRRPAMSAEPLAHPKAGAGTTRGTAVRLATPVPSQGESETPIPMPATNQTQTKVQRELPTPANTQTQSQLQASTSATSPHGLTMTINAGEEEVIGSIADSPLSSLPSGLSSPFIATPGKGFGGAEREDEDDDSEGDPDDYVEPEEDEDLEAAFAGRFRRSESFGDDDDDEMEDV